MQFTKVDEDAYDVRMNLDTLRRISNAFALQVAHESQTPDPDERNVVLRNSFNNGYESLKPVEVDSESTE